MLIINTQDWKSCSLFRQKFKDGSPWNLCFEGHSYIKFIKYSLMRETEFHTLSKPPLWIKECRHFKSKCARNPTKRTQIVTFRRGVFSYRHKSSLLLCIAQPVIQLFHVHRNVSSVPIAVISNTVSCNSCNIVSYESFSKSQQINTILTQVWLTGRPLRQPFSENSLV
jgi:hypothetical protein